MYEQLARVVAEERLREAEEARQAYRVLAARRLKRRAEKASRRAHRARLLAAEAR